MKSSHLTSLFRRSHSLVTCIRGDQRQPHDQDKWRTCNSAVLKRPTRRITTTRKKRKKGHRDCSSSSDSSDDSSSASFSSDDEAPRRQGHTCDFTSLKAVHPYIKRSCNPHTSFWKLQNFLKPIDAIMKEANGNRPVMKYSSCVS